MLKKLLTPFLAAAFLFAACNDDDKCTDVSGPVSVDVHKLESRLAGETVTVAVTAEGDWTVIPSSNWLTAETLAGSGSAKIVLEVAASNESAEREGEFVFVSGEYSDKLKVTQHGKDTNLADRMAPSFVEALAMRIQNAGTEDNRIMAAGDLAAISDIQVSMPIMVYSFKGIEFLTGLKTFSITRMTVTEIDLSRNPAIEDVDIYGCADLSELLLENCSELKKIVLEMLPALEEVDMSDCVSLDHVEINNCEALDRILIPSSLDTDAMSVFEVPDNVQISIVE